MLINGELPVYAEKIGLSFSQTDMERPLALVMQCITWFTLYYERNSSKSKN